MAGMWWNTIRSDLVVHPSQNTPPTRSWTSITWQMRHARVAGIPSDASFVDVLSVQFTSNAKSPMGAGQEAPASLVASGYLVPIDTVFFQHYSLSSEYYGPAESYRACYRVKWPSGRRLPESCVAMMDEHKATAQYEGGIQLDRLDGMGLENMDLIMLLTALSKGAVYGLLLNRRVTIGDMPEYERVGFFSGLDEIGALYEWSSNHHASEPMFTEDWEPEECGGIEAILEGAGIERSTLKIWLGFN
ncbi:hypothetical protein IFR05_011810 [Cadophora sp. M221]|nr:hypothetical protein IFR05_011810 [Cadophora sp. M221]